MDEARVQLVMVSGLPGSVIALALPDGHVVVIPRKRRARKKKKRSSL